MSKQSKNDYMLLFRGSEWYKELSLDEIQKILNLSKTWITGLEAQGVVKGGQGLIRKSAVVSAKDGQVVVDGPFAESKEAIGGYLLLSLNTFDEAVAIARSNPGLAYGTIIEVRPIAEECPLDACARQMEEQLAGTTA